MGWEDIGNGGSLALGVRPHLLYPDTTSLVGMRIPYSDMSTTATRVPISYNTVTLNLPNDYTRSTRVCDDSSSFRMETYDEWLLRLRREQGRCLRELQNSANLESYRRAERWLLEHLSRKQRESYRDELYFEVIGHETRRRYQIHRGLSGVRNVVRMEHDGHEWTPERAMCFHPSELLPEGDILLGQMIELTTDEPRVMRVANLTPIDSPPLREAA